MLPLIQAFILQIAGHTVWSKISQTTSEDIDILHSFLIS